MEAQSQQNPAEVSWSLSRYPREHAIVYSTRSPFHKDDDVSVTFYDSLFKLIETSVVPGDQVKPGTFLLRRSNRWIYASPDKNGLVAPDSKLSIEKFVGYDTPTHCDSLRLFFADKNVVAVSGFNDELGRNTVREINRQIEHYAFNPLVVFELELKKYAESNGKKPLPLLKGLLSSPSPHGRGMHDFYRNRLASLFE